MGNLTDNKDVVRRIEEALYRNDPAALDQYFAPASTTPRAGTRGFRRARRREDRPRRRDGAPGSPVRILDRAEGDKVFVRSQVTGTNTGARRSSTLRR